MPIYHLYGFRPVSFRDSKTNALIEGTSVYLGRPFAPGSGSGIQVDKIFVKKDIDCSHLLPDTDYYVIFNQYGKIEGFQEVGKQ